MARRKKLFKVIIGVLVGLFLAQFRTDNVTCGIKRQEIQEIQRNRTEQNLIFVGVMTAAK